MIQNKGFHGFDLVVSTLWFRLILTRAEVVSVRSERVLQGGARDQVPFEVVA